MDNEDIKECEHNIIWLNKRKFMVFPKKEYGVCNKCGKQFVKINGKIYEKGEEK